MGRPRKREFKRMWVDRAASWWGNDKHGRCPDCPAPKPSRYAWFTRTNLRLPGSGVTDKVECRRCKKLFPRFYMADVEVRRRRHTATAEENAALLESLGEPKRPRIQKHSKRWKWGMW